MIKQIINWTAGGFFRTLGKFILFGLIALILGYFMSQRNINLPLIGIGKVHAVVDEAFSSAESRLFLDNGGTETYTSWQNIPYTQTASYPVTQAQYRLKATNGFKKDNTYRFKVSYLPSPDALHVTGIWFSDGSSSLDSSCTGWVRESNGYYANTCTVSPEVDLSSSQPIYVRIVFIEGYVNSVRSWVGTFVESKGISSTIEEQTIDITNAIDNTTNTIINNQNENTQAIIDANKVCNNLEVLINQTNYESLTSPGYLNSSGNISGTSGNVTNYHTSSYYNVNPNENYTLTTGTGWGNWDIYYCLYDSDYVIKSCTKMPVATSTTINVNYDGYIRWSYNINAQYVSFSGKSCKNGSQAITDTLTNTDTTTDVNDFAYWFNSFNMVGEGPLAQILLLPVNLITATLEPVDTPLCFTLKGKQVCFPNGSIIWSRSGCHENYLWFGNCPDYNAFKTFFRLVGEGLITWFILKKIARTIEQLLDPTKSYVEVMKL